MHSLERNGARFGRGHEEHHGRLHEAPRRGAGQGPQSLARGDRARCRGRTRRRSRDPDARRFRWPDQRGHHGRGSAPLRPEPGPSADRPGLCRRRYAGRSARRRNLRHEAVRIRVHGAGAGVWLSARRLPRARISPNGGSRTGLPSWPSCPASASPMARLSGSSASRLQRRCARRSSAAKQPSSAVAGWYCRPRRKVRCRRRSRSPRRRCARSRRAKTAAISTSSS